VLVVQDDGVGAVVAAVGAAAELGADGDLGGQADDGDADAVGYERGYGVVNVARVGREEGAVDYEDFAGPVGWGVTVGVGNVS
jgi:hypothetical protein